MKQIAAGQFMTLAELIGEIDKKHDHGNVSYVIRQFVLAHYQQQSTIQDDVG